MVKFNIFGKSKKLEPQTYEESSQTEFNNYSSMETNENLVFEKEITTQPVVDYHETLQTKKSGSRKNSSDDGYAISSSDQRLWRDVRAIEKKVDNIHINKSNKPTSELQKKVDKIIKKKEKK